MQIEKYKILSLKAGGGAVCPGKKYHDRRNARIERIAIAFDNMLPCEFPEFKYEEPDLFQDYVTPFSLEQKVRIPVKE